MRFAAACFRVLTHRSRVVSLDISAGAAHNENVIRQSGHSSYLVVDGSADDIVGFVNIKDLFGTGADARSIQRALQEPIFIQESFSALSLLGTFRETGNKMAIVIDEYGDIQGLVTPTDILESLVGEIRDHPSDQPEIAVRDDGSCLVDAHAPLYNVFDRLGLEMYGDPALSGFNTISGFILQHLDGIPKESDFIVYRGFRFEIVDMDGHRIDKILVSRISEDASENQPPIE
jgi:putative hemolysin